METKYCFDCDKDIPLVEFRKKQSSKYAICSRCKLNERRNPMFKLFRMYTNQKAYSKERGHPPPEYDREWMISFCLKNTYMKIWRMWKNSGYNVDLTPSMDRIDPCRHYTKDNIRLGTWRDNQEANFTYLSIPILQYTIDGDFIKEWPSCKEVERTLGRSYSHVREMISPNNGNVTTYRSICGYQWVKKEGVPASSIEPAIRRRGLSLDQYSLEGEFLKSWEDSNDVVREYGGTFSRYNRCARGKSATAAGFIWRKHEDDPPKQIMVPIRKRGPLSPNKKSK